MAVQMQKLTVILGYASNFKHYIVYSYPYLTTNYYKILMH